MAKRPRKTIDPVHVPADFPPQLSPEYLERSGTVTLAEARQWLKQQAQDQGKACPCCGAWTRFYERKINSTMGRVLLWLTAECVRSGGHIAWANVAKTAPRWVVRSNQLPTLRHWRLVEKQPVDPEATQNKSSGIWRPTLLGYRFAVGEEAIHKYVLIYKGDTYCHYGPMITVTDTLKAEVFDYGELMQATIRTRVRAEQAASPPTDLI